jgi:hypothetical protein
MSTSNQRTELVSGGAVLRRAKIKSSQCVSIAHAEEMQEMELRRESQLDKNPTHSSFFGGEQNFRALVRRKWLYSTPAGIASTRTQRAKFVRVSSATTSKDKTTEII